MVIWENTNIHKATYLFLMNRSNFKQYLEQLEIFICSPESVKRKYIAQKENGYIFHEAMGFIKRLRHQNIQTFEGDIFKILIAN